MCLCLCPKSPKCMQQTLSHIRLKSKQLKLRCETCQHFEKKRKRKTVTKLHHTRSTHSSHRHPLHQHHSPVRRSNNWVTGRVAGINMIVRENITKKWYYFTKEKLEPPPKKKPCLNWSTCWNEKISGNSLGPVIMKDTHTVHHQAYHFRCQGAQLPPSLQHLHQCPHRNRSRARDLRG